MSVRRIVVLGGSGFVGRHIVGRLVDWGGHVLVPTRSRERAKHLVLLPTVDVVEADIHDAATLGRLLAGAAAVVNLVGIINETRRGDFDRVHVELPRKVVAACRDGGVRRLLHMSALNADPNGPSRYLVSKGQAEALVAAADLDWTIFRPSVVFGREDSFLNLFARLERMLPVMALACPQAKFQPVWVGDVAQGFVRALGDERTWRQRYALCGPRVYTLRELVAYVGEVTGENRPIVPLGPGLSRLQARVLELLPGKLMTRDNIASMTLDNVCGDPYPDVLGGPPTALEAIAPAYLTPIAARSRYSKFRAEGGRTGPAG
ncbi:MAG TPA: complex I NDUFA9 subunit family protein [Casimicrobiaceae bacterium]|nr:complex I NDUFA9 subunit family protein [Casimicrobiaceae bacterium]